MATAATMSAVAEMLAVAAGRCMATATAVGARMQASAEDGGTTVPAKRWMAEAAESMAAAVAQQ